MVKLGLCGAGVMGFAIVKGLIASKFITKPEEQVGVFDPSEIAREKCKALKINFLDGNKQVVAEADVVLICVKPMFVGGVLSEIAPVLAEMKKPMPLIVSIAAGIQIADFESILPPGARVVRCMPNTPCSVGESATGYTGGKHATKQDLELVHNIFSSVGTAVHCPLEKDIDAVTGLAGSGPAYVFLFIEALADGGVRAGLTRQVALALAIQTVKGAAEMMRQTELHPGVLKDQVCSPGGTTIAGIEALESRSFRGTVMSAVVAATARAKELQTHGKM